MAELSVDQIEEPKQSTPGLSHLTLVVWLERTGLPAWQIAITSFLLLVIVGILMLILNRVPNPNMYSNVVAFVAIITFFMHFYLSMGRGWLKDLKALIEFDSNLTSVLSILEPSRRIARLELLIVIISALTNYFLFAPEGIGADLTMSIFVIIYYTFQYLFVVLSLDIFIRQILMLYQITDKIRLDLLQPDYYSILGNVMLRFLKLFIFGICVITFSLNIFVEGKLGTGQMLIQMLPYCVPGLIMLGLYMFPYNHYKNRMRKAKAMELNHIVRAISGDKAHLNASLIGESSENINVVDMLYYEDRIRNIKEWPFTDRIRSMLFFGVLPPLTWVIAALIEIFIESVI